MYPNGYNLDNTEGGHKELSLETRETISNKKRFGGMSEDSVLRVKECMEKLGVKSLPMGLQYVSDSVVGYEGFSVSGKRKKMFTAKTQTLETKLKLALAFHEIKDNPEESKTFREDDKKRVSELISKSKRGSPDSYVLEALAENKLDCLPTYIRYIKRSHTFWVAYPGHKNKYISTFSPGENLRISIEYLEAIRNGSPSES
jgi:hypothetical protein